MSSLSTSAHSSTFATLDMGSVHHWETPAPEPSDGPRTAGGIGNTERQETGCRCQKNYRLTLLTRQAVQGTLLDFLKMQEAEVLNI